MGVREFLVWRDAWLMGIGELDADHRELVRLINRLADDSDETPVVKRLNAITAHLHAHFAREEQFLDTIDYPGLAPHATDHLMQLAEFTRLRRELESGGSEALDDAARQQIKSWFFDHVVVQDRQYADFYRYDYLPRKQT